MKHDINLGIRRLGIVQCFDTFYLLHKSFPETPEELATVTSTILPEKQFEKYRKWFLDYTQGVE